MILTIKDIHTMPVKKIHNMRSRVTKQIILPFIKALQFPKFKVGNKINRFNYVAGMEGPEDAEAFIAKDGNNWIVMPLGKNGKD